MFFPLGKIFFLWKEHRCCSNTDNNKVMMKKKRANPFFLSRRDATTPAAISYWLLPFPSLPPPTEDQGKKRKKKKGTPPLLFYLLSIQKYALKASEKGVKKTTCLVCPTFFSHKSGECSKKKKTPRPAASIKELARHTAFYTSFLNLFAFVHHQRFKHSVYSVSSAPVSSLSISFVSTLKALICSRNSCS